MLTDEQKIILHLCMQAEKRGRDAAWITRAELLEGRYASAGVPARVHLRLMWAALTMPDGVLEWSADQQAFRMSAEAVVHVRKKIAARIASQEREAANG